MIGLKPHTTVLQMKNIFLNSGYEVVHALSVKMEYEATHNDVIDILKETDHDGSEVPRGNASEHQCCSTFHPTLSGV